MCGNEGGKGKNKGGLRKNKVSFNFNFNFLFSIKRDGKYDRARIRFFVT